MLPCAIEAVPKLRALFNRCFDGIINRRFAVNRNQLTKHNGNIRPMRAVRISGKGKNNLRLTRAPAHKARITAANIGHNFAALPSVESGRFMQGFFDNFPHLCARSHFSPRNPQGFRHAAKRQNICWPRPCMGLIRH